MPARVMSKDLAQARGIRMARYLRRLAVARFASQSLTWAWNQAHRGLWTGSDHQRPFLFLGCVKPRATRANCSKSSRHAAANNWRSVSYSQVILEWNVPVVYSIYAVMICPIIRVSIIVNSAAFLNSVVLLSNII
jgi:hypothetical protein